MMVAWGAPSSGTTPCETILEGSSKQAREDIKRHRDASVTVLAAWEDTVVNPLVERLNAAQRIVQAKKIDQEIKEHLKAMNQGPVKAFKAELGKAKRYLTKQESKVEVKAWKLFQMVRGGNAEGNVQAMLKQCFEQCQGHC